MPDRSCCAMPTCSTRRAASAGRSTCTSSTGASWRSARAFAPTTLSSIDFSELWLMPGVFDCHDHVVVLDRRPGRAAPDPDHAVDARGGAERAADARGRRHLRSRPLRGRPRPARLARRGFVPGPRLQISVTLICQTGGHGDGYLAGPGSGVLPDPGLPGPAARPRRRPGRDAPRRARDPPGGRRLDQACDDRRARLRPRPAARPRAHAGGDRGRRLRGRAQGEVGRRARLRRRGPHERRRGRACARSSTAAS